MKIVLTIIASLFISELSIAQPSNDDCSGAISLGTLPNPGVCGIGIQNGTTVSIATTNVGATPENPYVIMPGCGMASPANSVWYSFVTPSLGFGVNINVSGATFSNPNIALWTGTSCGNFSGVGCTVGAAGAANINIGNSIVPGNTYYIQISGNTVQSGTFNLNVNAFHNCSTCLNSSTLTTNPMPSNGTYQPGQTVSFCFHINQFTQTAQNWLHGVQLSFGAGWDVPSLITFPPPTYLGNPGSWSYYPAGVFSSANLLQWPSGFYFNDTLNDGNPGNNFGDGNLGLGGIVITTGAADWNFCWNVTVGAGSLTGENLCVTVNTSGDGESGAWTDASCTGDAGSSVCALAINGTIGINHLLNEDETITISPNPFTSQTTITFNEEQKHTTLKVTDVLGNTILQSTINTKQSTIDMNEFAKGIYFVEIKTEKGITNRKIVLQ